MQSIEEPRSSGAIRTTIPPNPLAPAVMVTGKGGVGKTTVAVGLALAAAQRGQEAHFIEFGESDSGEKAMHDGIPPDTPVTYHRIEAQEALIESATPMFGSAWLTRVALGNFAMRPLLRAAPAIRELAMLEAVRHVVEQHPGARVVVDMPATGHALSWLAVPEQGRRLVGRGPLFELCDRLASKLVHPGGLSVVVVTLAERLVLRETSELCAGLAKQIGLPVGRLVVNKVSPVPTAEAMSAARSLAESQLPLSEAARALMPVLSNRQQAYQEVVAAMSETFGGDAPPTLLLPRAPVDPSPSVVAEWLSERHAV